MSEDAKHTIRISLQSEIRAFEADIQRTGPKKDYYGQKQFDVRQAHLDKLRAALKELDRL